MMEDIEISTISNGDRTAVRVRNAFKTYNPNIADMLLTGNLSQSSTTVLKGLNLTVMEGHIYGLLGPSGCGKTTLLNCIVGRSNLDFGSITLNVQRRDQLGYMPQELTLHDQLTILETFYFFGYVFGMTNEQIKVRSADLIQFLDLPPGKRQLKTLSGGQQRRVSVAVTFMHDPKLLILDEPTVGLDVVLSQSIWKRLLHMASQGKSIIITTHYIQEARQAHKIGLMRNGVLLAEESPQQLMLKCNCDDLEEAFLFLSHKQENNLANEELALPTGPPAKATFEEDYSIFKYAKFKGVHYKNLTLLKKEYIFLMFVIVLPLMQTYLFNTAIGRKPKYLNLAVVNDELKEGQHCNSDAYRGCFFDDTPNLNLTLSCLYLEYLQNRTYNMVEYEDTAVALHDVRKNKAWGLLHFPQNYTAALANRMAYGTKVDAADVLYSNIDIWVDLSNQYIGNLVRYDMLLSMVDYLKMSLTSCGYSSKVGTVPISFEKPVFGSLDENFISYASTAILTICCFFFPSILTGGLILTEKLGGMMERMVVNGVSMIEIVCSVVKIQMVVHIIQTILVMLVMFVFFDNPLLGNVFLLSVLMILVGLSGMFFGFVLAVITNQISTAAYIGICANILLCFTSGLVWPTEAAHFLIRSVAWLFPLTMTTEAARAICAKNLPLSHPVVYKGFVSTVAWNGVFVLIIYITLKLKKDIWAVRK